MSEVPAHEGVKIANEYLGEHLGDYDKQIEKRHKEPPKSSKLEREKEIRNFNLQFAGHKSRQGEWHPLNPDVDHDVLPSPIPPLEDSLRIELESPIIIEDPETGQKFTVFMLNWDKTN